MTDEQVGAEEQGELETVEQEIAEQESQEQAKPELPEKYRGKSVEDIVRMHQEAEKLIGKQAQEVGEVRRLADELLRSQLNKPVEKEKPKEIDFFENPQEAIRQAVDSNPKVLAAEQYAMNVQREQSMQKLLQAHPDAIQLSQDSEFLNWVNGSKVRQQLFQQANANWDFDSANELIGTYKQLNAKKERQVSDTEKKARSDSIKAAAVDAGGSGESSKKVYRRADLINLRIRDPRKYEAMQPDIELAYSEGRVR